MVTHVFILHAPIGKYQPGVNKPDPKTWKANFRCAMNSLPDIEEVKDKSMKSGSNAFRMYRMLSPVERAAKKGIVCSVTLCYAAVAFIQGFYTCEVELNPGRKLLVQNLIQSFYL